MNIAHLPVLLALVSVTAWAGSLSEAPSGLIGQFRSASKRVCFSDVRGGRPVCSRQADVMTIERTPFGGVRDVKITAEFTLPDAQVCTFEGMGFWNAHEHRLSATDLSTGCELSLVPRGRELRSMVVRPDQCSSPCAGRSWLEGVVMRRR